MQAQGGRRTPETALRVSYPVWSSGVTLGVSHVGRQGQKPCWNAPLAIAKQRVKAVAGPTWRTAPDLRVGGNTLHASCLPIACLSNIAGSPERSLDPRPSPWPASPGISFARANATDGAGTLSASPQIGLASSGRSGRRPAHHSCGQPQAHGVSLRATRSRCRTAGQTISQTGS